MGEHRVLLEPALYKKPKVLALDDATSHLDIAGAQRVVCLQQGKVLELAMLGDNVPMRQSMEQ